MRILQINTNINTGSTGRIAEDIGKELLKKHHESFIVYGHGKGESSSILLRSGNNYDRMMHGLKSRLFDRHGFGSVKATKCLIKRLTEVNPDLIHLHNIHGYYINIKILFDFLRSAGIPIVWTLHDCWPFTGHCSYFDRYGCIKWQKGCYQCPNLKGYPKSWWLDHSKLNYQDKKRIFTSLKKMTIVTPSAWLAKHVQNSFFNHFPVQVIPNGVNLDIFKPVDAEMEKSDHLNHKKRVLGVANLWDPRKGLNDFYKLRNYLDESIEIFLVGLTQKQISQLPNGIIGITRTENINSLASLYSSADVFVNPTYIDNFPTTNIEALACGTPVITYNTGGSPEAIDNSTGFVVEKGNISELAKSVQLILENNKDHFRRQCRNRAERLFDKESRIQDYINLHSAMLQKTDISR